MSSKKYNKEAIEIQQRLQSLLDSRLSELKEKTGWKDQTVRKWVKGGLPELGNVYKICKAMGVTPTWLLTGKDDDVDGSFRSWELDAITTVKDVFINGDKDTIDKLIAAINAAKDTIALKKAPPVADVTCPPEIAITGGSTGKRKAA